LLPPADNAIRPTTSKRITYAEGSGEGRVFTGVCLCVCLSAFPHDISKADAARITKRDIQLFRHEFWKLIYFEVKRSKLKVTSHKNIALPAWVFF